MFIEIYYDDSLGSRCPFCGHLFRLNLEERQRIEYPNRVEDDKVYTCLCKNNHLAFVKVNTVHCDDDYKVRKFMYIYERDWYDYTESLYYAAATDKWSGKKLAHFNIHPMMNYEDELWQITRSNLRSQVKRLEKQKAKQPAKKSKTLPKNNSKRPKKKTKGVMS